MDRRDFVKAAVVSSAIERLQKVTRLKIVPGENPVSGTRVLDQDGNDLCQELQIRRIEFAHEAGSLAEVRLNALLPRGRHSGGCSR